MAVDARLPSTVSDLQRATDALTLSRERYLGRLVEPRFATVPSLLAQLAEAIERSGELGAVTSSTGSRVPLDLEPVDVLRDITRGARARCALAGLRPRVSGVFGDLRQLAAHARGLVDYPAVSALSDTVVGWRDRAAAVVPESRTSRDLPALTCQRCKRSRVPVPDPVDARRRLIAPALRYVATPMPGVACRGCGHLYQGDRALRALAAWQGSERAGAA